jgi:hypothetical protein
MGGERTLVDRPAAQTLSVGLPNTVALSAYDLDAAGNIDPIVSPLAAVRHEILVAVVTPSIPQVGFVLRRSRDETNRLATRHGDDMAANKCDRLNAMVGADASIVVINHAGTLPACRNV